ncbi:hypothetical protein ABK040_005119 [Willaertia magna]
MSTGHNRPEDTEEDRNNNKKKVKSSIVAISDLGYNLEQVVRQKNKMKIATNNASTNYFNISILPGSEFYIYRVDFAIEGEENSFIGSFAGNSMLRVVRKEIDIGYYLFNGHDSLITLKPIDESKIKEEKDENGVEKPKLLPAPFKIKRKGQVSEKKGMISFRLINKLRHDQNKTVHKEDSLFQTLINEALKASFLKAGFKEVGASICNTKSQRRLQSIENTDVFDGFIPTVNILKDGYYVGLSFKNKFMKKEKVYDYLMADINHGLKQEQIKNRHSGLSVIPTYDIRNHIIRFIDFSKTPRSTFKLNGVVKTYADYYKEKYNLEIKDLTQPLISVTIKRRNQKKQNIYLVPELTFVCGIQPKELRSIGKEVSKSAMEKNQFILNAVDTIRKSEEFKKWGLEISTKPKEVKSYQLLDPVRIEGGGKYVLNNMNGSWKHDIKNFQLVQPIVLDRWIVVYTDRGQYDDLYHSVMQFGSKMGIKIADPLHIQTQQRDNAGEQYIDALLQNENLPFAQAVVCILPNPDKYRYRAIKTFVQGEKGLICQCVQQKNLRNPSIMTNVILQIQAKLQSILWEAKTNMDNEISGFTSLCGVATEGKGKNVKGAITLSINSKQTLYTTSEFSGVNRREVFSKVCSGVLDATNDFNIRNKGYPNTLIVYREGVSDGEIERCIANEVEPLVHHLGTKTKLVYILVSKNNNTRFLQNGKNLPIGSIIEDVQRANTHEFYITSTYVSESMGVTRPIRYQLLFNNSNIKTDAIYTMTYKQCHMYYNWPGTVKVPAPLMYSSKCLQSLSASDFNPQLKKNLFFL